MARAKVTHSTDSCVIVFEGDRKHPEPSTAAIEFPGGNVEVTRTSDGTYWAHIAVYRDRTHEGGPVKGEIIDSRIDYDHDGYKKASIKIPDIPHGEHVQHIAIKVARS